MGFTDHAERILSVVPWCWEARPSTLHGTHHDDHLLALFTLAVMRLHGR
jgi:hypothetical protein